MPVILRASFGYLMRHPWQLALAIVGIGIGVAVMVAVDLANQSSRKAFLLSMDTLNGQATHQVVGGPAGIDEALYTSLRVQHGVRTIAPIVSGYVSVAGEPLQLLGVDVFAEREFRQYTAPTNPGADLAGDGALAGARSERMISGFLAGSGNVLLAPETAARLGLESGQSFAVVAEGRENQATVAGFVGGENQGQLANIMIVDIAVAQRWLDMQGRLSRIDVRIDDDELQARLVAALPDGTNLLSAAGRTQTTADMSKAFMTNLSAMSLLAMLVGIFLIYNSVAFAVLQRRDLIGILRALGLTRRQTLGLILGEAAILGVIGAALGVAAGIFLGERLLFLVARTISDHYFFVNVTSLSIDAASVAKGVASGIGATLLAAAVPAFEASSYAPRLAMTRSSIESRAGRMVPLLAVGGLAMMGLAAVVILVSGRSLVAGLSALFMLILGFSFCVPLIVKAVSVLLEPLAARIGGTPGRLAVGGIVRALSRTGVAIVALAVAVSATIGVSVMVGSFRASVSDWLGASLQSDVYVGVPRGSLDPVLLEDLVSQPGIRAYSTSRRAWIETESGRTRIIAIRPAPGSEVGTVIRSGDPDSVWQRFAPERAVLVSDSYAWRHDVAAGDAITLASREGPVDLAVAAVYQSYDSNDGAIMMSRHNYDALFDDDGVDSIGLYLEDGVDADTLMDRLRELGEGRQALIMNSNARIRDLSLGIFDRTFVITNVLYWLAVGVAIIGILGAMLALQLERGREFAILRALGMTPGQTGTLVTVQCGFIGLLAGLASLPLGLLMAWILIEVINRRAFGWQIGMLVETGPLLSALALAIVAALMAGIYPSWRAAGSRPALAMREE
jgi:putative ABC transport system permease protein